MSRLLNQERTTRGRPVAPAPATFADPEPLNRVSDTALPPTASPAFSSPRRHPFKRGVVLVLLFSAPLAWYGWIHRPPDPWIPLLEGPQSPALLSPTIADLAVLPEAPAPAPTPVAALPPEPLPFAKERVTLATSVPSDLAIEVRTGKPPRPQVARFPDDPALTQAVDALIELEEALQGAAALTSKTF